MTAHPPGNRFWIADLHFGHEKVSGLRGFASTEEHDAAVLEPLLALKPSDTAWVLGDLSSSKPADQLRALDLLSSVPATLHLIAGNHDMVSSIHRNGWKHQRLFLQVFESVQQFGRCRLESEQVLMSHYPYARAGDGPGRGTARYLEYRLPDAEQPLIHGHTHHVAPHMPTSDTGLERSADIGPGDVDQSMFCVSWDVNRGLVPEQQLNQWLQMRRKAHRSMEQLGSSATSSR